MPLSAPLPAVSAQPSPGTADPSAPVNPTPPPRELLGRCGLDHKRADAGLIVTHEHIADKLTAAMDASLGKD